MQVEVANLRPNPWNTNSVGAQNFEKLKGSIEKLGFFKPILTRELDGGFFEILGGEHRWRAAMEQGISTVPVISVGKINDLVAKQMSLVDNERYGEDDQVALQRLIEEIQSEIDYRLGVQLPYRQIIKNTCPWKYRGAECGYTGPYFDKNNRQTTLAAADYCTKRYDACTARKNFFANGVIHFGGFIGATRYES
ncbi:phage minor tail protein L [Cronobacter sakazakii]|nr:phage minor tail protein L [Cronobacter sakazakii]EKK4070242.1 phage minor tail protein L [Cronobacter sakazakii]